MIRTIGFLLCFSALALGQQNSPLDGLANLSDAVSKRASSADVSGGNADWIPLKAGSTATLADIKGAGSIRHIWFTINSPSQFHLRELVLRMYWDGETDPSVEVPIGDFFGTGFEFAEGVGQKYHSWWSLPITVQDRALNCYFQMPFGNGARITLTNDGTQDVNNLYFHVDYQEYRNAQSVSNEGRFHAQWRHELTRAIPESESAAKNVDGKNNYVFMEAKGKGQYVGTILNVFGLSTGWWGEGDDMFFVDGEKAPSLKGTGAEDYVLGAHDFGGVPFSYGLYGAPVVGEEKAGGRSSVYRFHLEAPIPFQKSFKATIEHGHANHRSDNYSSVAYWYQAEPHGAFPALPPVSERLPALQPTGGPGNGGSLSR